MQGAAGVYQPYLPTEITALDSLRVGKGLVDHAIATTQAFITHEWIHIELPPVDPVPPPYPDVIDPLAGINAANAAAVGKKYFQDAYSHVLNLGMPPGDPNEEVPALEIRPEEGLSPYNASIVGRKVVEDILSYVIESVMNTGMLIYTVGKTVMNVAKKVLGIPIIEEPVNGANPDLDADELNALDELGDADDVGAPEDAVDVDEEAPAELDLDGNPLDIDGEDLDVDDGDPLDDGLEDADSAAILGGGVPLPHGFTAPNPGDPTGAPTTTRTRRVPNHASRVQQAPQPPPPRIEDTDPFYTMIPQMTQPQIEDLTSVLTLLNGNMGSITMNAGSLRKKGANIDGVHPFRFLYQVMTTPDLREKFKTLRARNDLIGKQFVAEFNTKFNGYQDRGELLAYHKGFAHAMRVNPANVEKLCNNKNWRLLIVLLYETATGAIPAFVPKPPPPVKQLPVARTPARRQPAAQAGQPAFMPQPGTSNQNPFGIGSHQAPQMQIGNPFAGNTVDDGLDIEGSDAEDPIDDVDGEFSEDEVGSDDDVQRSPEVDDQVEDAADDLGDLAICNPLTEEQKTIALRIFQRVATERLLTLGFHALNIKNDWRQLQDTHPAMLLREVFENPEIANHLWVIRQDVIKRDLFLNDFCDALAKGEQNNPDNTLDKTNETLIALGSTKTLTSPIDWKIVVKDLITDKCITRTSDLLTPVQTHVLGEVLTDIARTSEFMLLGHLISLRKKWTSLESTCPLQLLRWMFTENLDLVSQIVSKPAKKGSFLNDVASTLKNCSKMRDFSSHITTFAAEFNIDENLLANKNWAEVLKAMIDEKVIPSAVATPKIEVLPQMQTSDPLSGIEKQTLDELFSTLADDNGFQLLGKMNSLREKWASLTTACPLQILRYVFIDKKDDFHKIINQSIKRQSFLNDLVKTVEKAGKERDLSSFAADFSLEFSIPQDMIAQKEWTGVINTIKAKQVADSERASQISTESRASSSTGRPLPAPFLPEIHTPAPTPKSDPLSPGEKQAIDELFFALETKNEIWLLGNVSSLQRKWSSLEQACPLQILRYIFTDKKDAFHHIINQMVRRGPFLNDLLKTVKNASKERDLTTFAEAFSLEFSVPQDLILHKDWAKIVDTIKAKQIADSERVSQTSINSRASSSSGRPIIVQPLPQTQASAPIPKSDPLSGTEKQAIDELFSALATKNEMWLFGNTIPLQRKWSSLEQACPLQILRYVFIDKKDTFHQIINQMIRRGPFLTDLVKTVKNAGKESDLIPFAEAFSLEFSVPQDLIIRKEWGAVIDKIKTKQIDDAETASRTSSNSNLPRPKAMFGNPFKADGFLKRK